MSASASPLGRIVATLWIATTVSTSLAQSTATPDVPRTAPTVIHDGGGIDIAPYLDQVTAEFSRPGQSAPPAMPSPPAALLVFPVVTTRATPARLPAPTHGKLKGGPGVPICILGDDALSQKWLRINQTALLRMKATCLVASVRDEAAWRNLQSLAGDLPLTPGSFDALAQAMGIFVYPILVSPDGLVSQ